MTPSSSSLPSRIRWKPLRYGIGVLVSALVLLTAPVLSLGVLLWNGLCQDAWAGLKAFAKGGWEYLKAWAHVTGVLWMSALTRNSWFRGDGDWK